jgi:hypothetical protein
MARIRKIRIGDGDMTRANPDGRLVDRIELSHEEWSASEELETKTNLRYRWTMKNFAPGVNSASQTVLRIVAE